MSSDSPAPGNADVRMSGFAQRTTVEAAIQWVDKSVQQLPASEVSLADAAGRVLAESITSPVNVPGFTRSMMDGYAIIASDVAGASMYNPISLQVAGEVLPGQAPSTAVTSGKVIRIMTGAAMPDGADAVIPVEQLQASDDGSQVEVHADVPPGKHVGQVGEDVSAGTTLFSAGRQLRPQDLGLLSSVGISQLAVVSQPRVRILVTGNELLPAGTPPAGQQITDANSPMLSALIERDGGIVDFPGILPDQAETIEDQLQQPADIILVAGGSSVGQEDYAPSVVRQLGELAIHGIAMRPSSPAGMGTIEDRLVFLLPGNPVSCLCAYDFFAGRAIRQLAGLPAEFPYQQCRLPLARKLVSAVGRVDYARVEIIDGQVEPLAISGASILSSTTRASGYVIVPQDSEGMPAGSEVDVWLYG
jgi:molybdopterin molybdotransferase